MQPMWQEPNVLPEVGLATYMYKHPVWEEPSCSIPTLVAICNFFLFLFYNNIPNKSYPLHSMTLAFDNTFK